MDSLYILLAALFVQGAHTYLLVTQRNNPKWSISQHAADSSTTKTIYRVGHFVGGAFWLVAMNLLFAQPELRFMFYIAVVSVLLEWLQALFLKDTHKLISVHAAFAYCMWVGNILTSILAAIYLSVTLPQQLIAAGLLLAVVLTYLYMHLQRTALYKLQYWSIYGLLFAMFILSF